MFYGKIIAGLLGFLLLGPVGLILGVAVGYAFDRGLVQSMSFATPESLAQMRQQFSETCFTLLGFVAKADGRVSEEEIAQAEHIMGQLGIEGEHRQNAIAQFRRGASPDLEIAPVIEAFLAASKGHKQLSHTLLMFLMTMALADGVLDMGERRVLEATADLLGYTKVEFERLLGMIEAQSHFHEGGNTGYSEADLLADAYRALGAQESDDDRAVKRAYRKLMSQNHPDKLAAKGVPEDMLKLATEKTQEIQAAYELICDHRKR